MRVARIPSLLQPENMRRWTSKKTAKELIDNLRTGKRFTVGIWIGVSNEQSTIFSQNDEYVDIKFDVGGIQFAKVSNIIDECELETFLRDIEKQFKLND